MQKNVQPTAQLYQNNAQNSPSEASTVSKLRTSRYPSWITEETDQIINIYWITEKAREFQKNICFYFIDYSKAFGCGSQQTVENSSKDGNTRAPYLPSEKSVCRSRSNS